jgi:hypothetical protein
VTTHTDGSRYVAAYRHWMGLVPYPLGEKATPHTAHSEERAGSITLRNPVELIVLSVKQTTARCRPLQSDHTITLRAGRIWHVIPGEIAVVRPHKQWNYGGTAYLSGLLESTRIDASALGLVPLKLEDQGNWNPAEEYWGEQGELIEKWAKPIIARGPRRQFEMERVLPGADPDIRFQTRSQNPTTARMLVIRKAQETYCWNFATSAASTLTLISATWCSTIGQRTRFGTMRLDFGLGNSHWERVSTDYCRGAGSIIGHSSVACTDSDCVFGA